MGMKYHRNFYNFEIPYKNGALLYNIVNRNFVFLNKEYYYLYQHLDLLEKDENKHILNEFMDAEFILDNSVDERNAYLRNFYFSRWFSQKLLFTIVPTTACNFRCPYCFEQGIKFISMNTNIVKKSMEFIEERIKTFKPEDVSISFYGGEPLLALDKIVEFGMFFKRLGHIYNFKMNADVVTNGYLLSKEVALELYNKARVRSAQITLDGPEEVHDARRFLSGGKPTFQRIYNNVKEVLMTGIEFVIRVRVNVDKTNIGHLEDLLAILSELPERDNKLEVYFSPVTGESDKLQRHPDSTLFSEEEFGKVYVDKILPLLYKYDFDYERYPDLSYVFCGGITPYHYIIDSDGSIKKCYDLVGRKEESIGDVYNYRDDDKRVLKWELFEPLGDECFNCKFLPICGGGCPYKKMKSGKNVCEPWRYVLKDLLIKIYELKTSEEKRDEKTATGNNI